MPVLLITTTLALLASLSTRLLVEAFLTERIPIIGASVGLEVVQNAGIAFGIDIPSPFLEILIAIALSVVCCLAHCYRRGNVDAIAYGLIIGGAVANIFDRIGDGLVTDFIQVGWWPLFNVADSCIMVGVVLLLLWEVWQARRRDAL